MNEVLDKIDFNTFVRAHKFFSANYGNYENGLSFIFHKHTHVIPEKLKQKLNFFFD